MEFLSELIRSDMKPALGVTEPGAIALAAATARAHAAGEIVSIAVAMNSGMYKNAFTCGIPNSSHVGALYSAALGVVAGDPGKGLESLAGITQEDNRKAEQLIRDGKVSVSVSEVTSRIFISAELKTDQETIVVTIRDSHTNICSIRKNGRELLDAASETQNDAGVYKSHEMEPAAIHGYTLAELLSYVKTVPAEEIGFIKDAYATNLALFEEGLSSDRTVILHQLLEENGGVVISDNVQKTASLLCNGAIEARVIGLNKPAMSITGSGAHGIIATLPLYAAYKIEGYSEEELCRATALSYLICMYIKEYSGKLSAFCGCGIAAGTGMACALAYLRGAEEEKLKLVINNMAAGITGMICDGGNQGCAMKGIVAVDAAFRAVRFAGNDVGIGDVHGICAVKPEETMHNMGLIAFPGMTGTEKTIIDILEAKHQE